MNEEVRHSIEAGDSKIFSRNTNDWIFWDMSFSKSKTSGLILPDGSESTTTWSNASEQVFNYIEKHSGPFFLMLEAPLSFSFKDGNPIRRAFEPVNYEWYRNAGGGLAWGAAVFLNALSKTLKGKIYLFEAFITNANKTLTSKGADSHIRDARLMRRIVVDESTELLKNLNLENTTIESSTKRFGLDFGIPPVLVANKE